MMSDNEKKQVALKIQLWANTMGGYRIKQIEGQRFFGPPVWYTGSPPEDTEVFVNYLPRDFYEDELVPIFQTVGVIYQIRLMMDFSGSTRGAAYISFFDKESVEKALRLSRMSLRDGAAMMTVHRSFNNRSLFIGNLPPNINAMDLETAITSITAEVIVDLTIYRLNNSIQNPDPQQEYALVQYATHTEAILARKQLQKLEISINKRAVIVDWSQFNPNNANNKSLFFRDMPMTVSVKSLAEKINDIIYPERVVDVVRMNKNVAAEFSSQPLAETARRGLKNTWVGNHKLEVTWNVPNNRNRKFFNKKITNDVTPASRKTIIYDSKNLKIECLTKNLDMLNKLLHHPKVYNCLGDTIRDGNDDWN